MCVIVLRMHVVFCSIWDSCLDSPRHSRPPSPVPDSSIAQAGNYNQPTAPGAPYTKASFDTTLSKAGFEGKTVPTLDAFFPFAKCVALDSHSPPPHVQTHALGRVSTVWCSMTCFMYIVGNSEKALV